MSYIAILPKSANAEQQLVENSPLVMDILYKATKDTFNIPDHDIIVELNKCSVIAFNPAAVAASSVPDVVIKISTSDHDLQPRFQPLCDRIVADWDQKLGKELKLEIWVNLIDTWGTNIDFS